MGAPTDWQENLVRCLLAAGTVGKKQTELLHRLKNVAKTKEITNELEAMQAQDKVQKFNVPPEGGKGRQVTVWRATTKLLEGWP